MNHNQNEAIINYMGSHSRFAAGQRLGNNAKAQKSKQLSHLKIEVDSCGTAKSCKQIQDKWSSLKSHARKYNAEKNVFYQKTGNNTNEKFEENQQLENVLGIVGKSHGNGLNIVSEIGLSSASNDTLVGLTALPKKAKTTKNRVVYVMPEPKSIKNAVALNKISSTTVESHINKTTLPDKTKNLRTNKELPTSQLLSSSEHLDERNWMQQVKDHERQLMEEFSYLNETGSSRKPTIVDVTHLLSTKTKFNGVTSSKSKSSLAQFFQKETTSNESVGLNEPQTNIDSTVIFEPFVKPQSNKENSNTLKQYLAQNKPPKKSKEPILLDCRNPPQVNKTNSPKQSTTLVPFVARTNTAGSSQSILAKDSQSSKTASNFSHSAVYNQYLSSWRKKPTSKLDAAIQMMHSYTEIQDRIAENLEDLVTVKKRKLEIYENYCQEKLKIMKSKK